MDTLGQIATHVVTQYFEDNRTLKICLNVSSLVFVFLNIRMFVARRRDDKNYQHVENPENEVSMPKNPYFSNYNHQT